MMKQEITVESKKLGLAFSLITFAYLLCIIFTRCCKKKFNRSFPLLQPDSENQLENYQNMQVSRYNKKAYFGMMYFMVLVNFLTQVIYIVGTEFKN